MGETRTTVLYVDHFPDVGGGQVSLLTRLDHLDRECWDPIVATSQVEGEFHAKLAERDVKVVRAPLNRGDVRSKNEKGLLRSPRAALGNISTVARATRTLVRIIRDEDVRLVHSNSFKGAVLSALPARLTSVPFVFHARSSRAYSDHGLFDHYVCALADQIVANSAFTADTFGRWAEKATVIHSPVDVDAFDPSEGNGAAVRAELGVGDAPLIGHVGRLTPRKRQIDLVRALPEIRERHPAARVLLVGGTYEGLGGSYRDRLEAAVAENDVGDAVHFLGHRNDIVDVMAALDVLTLPSLREPMGRVVVEALLTETPVVGSDSGGIPELVTDEETGLLVPERDPGTLAVAISRLLTNEEWASSLARRGRAEVRDRFNARTITEREEALYEELLRGKP